MKVPTSGSYAVYASWPSSSGYNTSTPVGILTTSGWKWVHVNQTKNGDRWVYLGTFKMKAGDRQNIEVSRWTSGKGYVIADAVKIARK